MFYKLLVFCAVGVLVPTCNCFYTFSVNKPAANYIEENNIEDSFPTASGERDLIDIRPEEALDNEIPNVDDAYLKNDVEDNIVEVDLEPEYTWRKDTELSGSDEDEEHFWAIFKKSTEKPGDKDVYDITTEENLETSSEGKHFWPIYKATTEENLETSSEGRHFWPIYKATTEENLEASSEGKHFWPIYKATTEENLEKTSESNINIVTDAPTNNDDDSFISFKFSFNSDALFNNEEDDVNSNGDSSVNFFRITFNDNIDEQKEEEKPDITIVLPDEVQPTIDDDEEIDYEEILDEKIKAMMRLQEVIQELEKMAAELNIDSNKDDMSPLTTYDYVNRGYTPYSSPYADFEETETSYNSPGYFGSLDMSSTDLTAPERPYERIFKGHKWHDAPVYRPYYKHSEDLY